MTKFSFEVPYQHLNDFHDLQDFYFILSCQEGNQIFRAHMNDVMVAGLHSIWVDNSFNETQLATHHHEVLHVFNELRAQKIIPPDALGWTSEQIIEQVREIERHDIPLWKMSIVTSSPRIMFAVYAELIAARNIAIPYATRDTWGEEDMHWAFCHYNVHYLGLNNLKEIIAYQPDSCDTGMPIKLALQDKTLDDWVADGCPHIYNKDLGEAGRDYFNSRLTPEQLDLARRNICQLKELTKVQTIINTTP